MRKKNDDTVYLQQLFMRYIRSRQNADEWEALLVSGSALLNPLFPDPLQFGDDLGKGFWVGPILTQSHAQSKSSLIQTCQNQQHLDDNAINYK